MKKWVTGALLLGIGAILGGCYGAKAQEESKKEAAQKIQISLPAPLSTLDTTQMTDKNTFTIAQNIFEGLYRLDETATPKPGLAKDVKVSEDGKTYTFTLKENLKWSDGTQLTADDFLYAWTRLVDPKTQGPNAYLLDSVVNSYDIRTGKKESSTIGLSAPDAQTFIVQLAQAQPSFLSVVSIAWLAPQKQSYIEEQGENYAQTSEKLLYSGPFIVKNWSQTSDTWTLVPNKEYYDHDKVELEEVDGSTIKEETTGINLYKDDQLDLVRISGQNVQQYNQDPGFVSHNDIANYFLDFNKKEGTALANVHLRQAIARAINKEDLAKNVLNDGSKPLNGLIPRDLYQNPETKQDFREYSGDYLVYDQTQAQKEWTLAQQELGTNVTIDLLVSDDDNGKKISEYIQAQIQDTLPGVKIVITPQPKNNLNQARRDKNYELSLSGWIAGSSDLDSYFNLYQTDSAYNYGEYENDTYRTLVEAAKTTDANDPDKQFSDYKQAETQLLEKDAAQVPLYQSASNYLIRDTIKGIQYPLYGTYFDLKTAKVTEGEE